MAAKEAWKTYEEAWEFHTRNMFNQSDKASRRKSYIFLIDGMVKENQRFSEPLHHEIGTAIIGECEKNIFLLLKFVEIYAHFHKEFLAASFRLYPIFRGLIFKFEQEYTCFEISKALKNTMKRMMWFFKHSYFVILTLRFIAETSSPNMLKWAMYFTEWLCIDQQEIPLITPFTPLDLLTAAFVKIIEVKKFNYSPKYKVHVQRHCDKFLVLLWMRSGSQFKTVTDTLGGRIKEEVFLIIRNVGLPLLKIPTSETSTITEQKDHEQAKPDKKSSQKVHNISTEEKSTIDDNLNLPVTKQMASIFVVTCEGVVYTCISQKNIDKPSIINAAVENQSKEEKTKDDEPKASLIQSVVESPSPSTIEQCSLPIDQDQYLLGKRNPSFSLDLSVSVDWNPSLTVDIHPASSVNQFSNKGEIEGDQFPGEAVGMEMKPPKVTELNDEEQVVMSSEKFIDKPSISNPALESQSKEEKTKDDKPKASLIQTVVENPLPSTIQQCSLPVDQDYSLLGKQNPSFSLDLSDSVDWNPSLTVDIHSASSVNQFSSKGEIEGGQFPGEAVGIEIKPPKVTELNNEEQVEMSSEEIANLSDNDESTSDDALPANKETDNIFMVYCEGGDVVLPSKKCIENPSFSISLAENQLKGRITEEDETKAPGIKSVNEIQLSIIQDFSPSVDQDSSFLGKPSPQFLLEQKPELSIDQHISLSLDSNPSMSVDRLSNEEVIEGIKLPNREDAVEIKPLKQIGHKDDENEKSDEMTSLVFDETSNDEEITHYNLKSPLNRQTASIFMVSSKGVIYTVPSPKSHDITSINNTLADNQSKKKQAGLAPSAQSVDIREQSTLKSPLRRQPSKIFMASYEGVVYTLPSEKCYNKPVISNTSADNQMSQETTEVLSLVDQNRSKAIVVSKSCPNFSMNSSKEKILHDGLSYNNKKEDNISYAEYGREEYENLYVDVCRCMHVHPSSLPQQGYINTASMIDGCRIQFLEIIEDGGYDVDDLKIPEVGIGIFENAWIGSYTTQGDFIRQCHLNMIEIILELGISNDNELYDLFLHYAGKPFRNNFEDNEGVELYNEEDEEERGGDNDEGTISEGHDPSSSEEKIKENIALMEQEKIFEMESDGAGVSDQPVKRTRSASGSRSASETRSASDVSTSVFKRLKSSPSRIFSAFKRKTLQSSNSVPKEIMDHQSDIEELNIDDELDRFDIDDESFYEAMRYFKKWKKLKVKLEGLLYEIHMREIELNAAQLEIDQLRYKIRFNYIRIQSLQQKTN